MSFTRVTYEEENLPFRPSDFLLSPSSIPKELFCSEYNFNDGPHYSPKAQGIIHTEPFDREFSTDTQVFINDIWHHVARKLAQRDEKSKPWGLSHFITLYESQRLAEDESIQLSVVGKGDIDDGKSVNKAVRIENGSKPGRGFKVYQISGEALAARNVSIIKASDAVRGSLPEHNASFHDSVLLDFNICEDEYWVWGMVPADTVKKAISYKSIFAARMAELDETKDDRLDEDDETFRDAVEKQTDEMEDQVKLRGGAAMQTARNTPPGSPDHRKATRDVAQPAQNKTSKARNQTYELNSEDSDDDNDEGIPAVAKPKRTVAFVTPEPRPHPKVETRHATATKSQKAGQSSKSGPRSSSKVNYGTAPLPYGHWDVQEILDYRWAKDKDGNLLKNGAHKPYLEYLVKWDGVGEKGEQWSEDQYDSWEPTSSFRNTLWVLDEFWEDDENDKPTKPPTVTGKGKGTKK